MSGSIIGGIIGGAIGFVVTGGNPYGALYGFSLGSAAGGILFPTNTTQQGPRLDDLKAQASQYGAPIPIVYGTAALQGQVIWSADIKEVQSESHQGKGGPSQTSVNYSYFGSFAVALCEGPITGVLRIWSGPDKRLIYDGSKLEGGSIRVYLGTEDQQPDPLIEAAKGVGLTPAYRGTAYVVLEDFPLANDGNRIPFLTFEITTGDHGGTCGVGYQVVNNSRLYDVPPVKLGVYGSGVNRMVASDSLHPTACDSASNIYVLVSDSANKWYVKKVSSAAPIQESLLYLGDPFISLHQCAIAYDPNANKLGVVLKNSTAFALIDCASFTATFSTLPFKKADIIFSVNEQRFRMLDWVTSYVGTKLSEDCYGLTNAFRQDGVLIECGSHGIVVCTGFSVYQNGGLLVDKECTLYDPVRDRLINLGTAHSSAGYYEFATGQTFTPASGAPTNIYPVYLPLSDRIVYGDFSGLSVMNPADITPQSMPQECTLFNGTLMYADGGTLNFGGDIVIPVALPNTVNGVGVVESGILKSDGLPNDIFKFSIGVRGVGVTLASIITDLSSRAGESRIDVSQLSADTVDGYVIARQTDIRAAMQPLRSAYYFDAVESQGVIRYVKRGGATVTVIDDADLAARDAGSDAPDPLQTSRTMEAELPRAVTVSYLLAATNYDQATQQARRLIGASGTETTLELPLVLTDTKAKEVAQVNLHGAWVERLSYEFTLPRKYSHLEPTDLILVKGFLMRLVTVKATPKGVLQCSALADESGYYAPHIVVTETTPKIGAVSAPGMTLLELF